MPEKRIAGGKAMTMAYGTAPTIPTKKPTNGYSTNNKDGSAATP